MKDQTYHILVNSGSRDLITCDDLTDESLASYLGLGYTLALAEDVMRFDLERDPSARTDRQDIALQTGDDQRVGAFFEVYSAAFRDRPGFPGWREDAWVRWLTGDTTFRPDLTWLGLIGGQAAGFIAAADDETGTRVGWTVQVGVVPALRRRGIASELVARSLRAWRRDGKESVMLQVNVNNPSARSLYERMGFVFAGRRGVLRR